MSETFQRVLALLRRAEVRVSEHGYDQLAEDGIAARDVVAGADDGAVIEDYADYPKGPCVLVLQRDAAGSPIHVVWGIPKEAEAPAVLVTAYRPSPDRWTADFLRRRP